MELRHLRYFVAAAEEENISKAAARLHIAQPPLSRQIKDLEETLGVALFHRKGNSIKLTEAGQVFKLEAQAVLQRAEEALQVVRAFKPVTQRQELHIAYSPSLTVDLLPQLLREFQDLEDVQVVLHDMSSAEMLDGLVEGKLGLAISKKPDRMPRSLLEYKEIRGLQISVAFAASHPLAASVSISLEAALQYPLIIFSREEYPEYYTMVEMYAKTIGVKLNIREEYDGATSLIAAVEAGRGVAIVAETFHHFCGNRLLVRELSPPPEPMSVGCLFSKQQCPPLAVKFLEMALNRP